MAPKKTSNGASPDEQVAAIASAVSRRNGNGNGLVDAPEEQSPPQAGLRIASTGLRRLGGYVSADFLPKLVGINGYRAFREMSRNDPIVGAILFAISMLIRNIEWELEPADDTPDATKKCDLLKKALFKKLRPSFSEAMSEACSMFTYGYSPLEIVWGNIDGAAMPVGLYPISQESVLRWEFDDAGDVTGLWQADYFGGRAPMRIPVFIPIEKLCLFQTESSLANPEGRSILRTSYTSWVRKKAIEEAEGRAAIRAAGVVLVRIPSKIINAKGEEYNSWLAVANNLAVDRTGSVILPSDLMADGKPHYSVEYLLADSRRSTEFNSIIERIDKRMAQSVLADFILLGQGSQSHGGSHALSKDKTSMMTTALWAWALSMASTLNRQIVNRTWALNGWDDATIPTMVAGDIKTPDLAEMASYLTSLGALGMTLFPDPALEEYFRQLAGMPPASPESQARFDLEAQAASDAKIALDQARAKDPIPAPAPKGPPAAKPVGKEWPARFVFRRR